MQIFDADNNIVNDDLEKTIKLHSKVSIVVACFSMYAYNNQLCVCRVNSISNERFTI